MNNFDEPFGILHAEPQHHENFSITSRDSFDPPSRKLSIFDFRSRRQSASPPNCARRDSVPMVAPQGCEDHFHRGDWAPPTTLKDETTSIRSNPSGQSLHSLDSIRSSTNATNTNPHPKEKINHKISKRSTKKIKNSTRSSEPRTQDTTPVPQSRPRSQRRSKALATPLSAQPTNPPSQVEIPEPPKSRTRQKGAAQKTRCTCRKTKCLKLYCECFAATGFCGPKCRCEDCHNKETLNELRQLIISETVGKNPLAFKSKFKKVDEKNIKKLHSRGCNCRKTGCVKNYCECFHAGIGCSPLCKCEGCKNEQLNVELKDVTAYRDKVLRKRKRRNYLYDFYFAKCQTMAQ